MREIKFRAWDKKLKQMFEFELMWCSYIDAWKLPYPTLVGIGSNWVENENHFTDLMQYTGLKDKNGKEIYENDIIKYTAGENYQTTGVVTWVDEKNSVNFKTYPLVCAFVIHNEKENKTDKFEWGETGYMEVLGNIYEHPHLLESEDK